MADKDKNSNGDCKGQTELLRMAGELGFRSAKGMLRKAVGEEKAAREESSLYDLVFACDSVKALMPSDAADTLHEEQAAGCKVVVTSKLGARLFNEKVSSRRVAVVGQYNAGKTWVLQNLFKYKFPQGNMLRTKGLSMKMDEAKELLIIDSAGNLEPVSSDLNVAEAVHDRKNVEILTKEFLVEAADIVILVVNQLTWPEQENAQALANRCNRLRGEDGKLFIIVHNMSGVQEDYEARRRFREQIDRCYKGEKIQHMSKTSEILEFLDDGASHQTRHFGVANQYSEAGRKFNRPVFEEILKMIDHQCPVPKAHCMREVLEKAGTAALPQFFFTEPAMTAAQSTLAGASDEERQSGAMRLRYVAAEAGQGKEDIKEGREQVLGHLKIEVGSEHIFHARHQGVSTPLGDIGSLDLVWDPAVSTIFEPLDNDPNSTEAKLIEIEAPGCTEDHVDVEALDTGVLVTVRKPEEEDGAAESLEDSRHYGIWKRLFEYVDTATGAQYAWHDDGYKVENGIIFLELRKRELTKKLLTATKRADRH